MTANHAPVEARPRSALARLRHFVLGEGSSRASFWRASVFALLATAVTVLARLALDEQLASRPSLVILTLPILLSAYVGGLRAGLLATLLCCAAAAWLLLPPLHVAGPEASAAAWLLGFLALAGVVISLVNEGLHRARLRAEIATVEHDAASAAMRATEARYRLLFDSAPDGIVIADGESNYLDANPAACAMLGYTHAELVGLHARDIVEPDEQVHISPALAKIRSDAGYQREWRFRRKDGSTFVADVQATTMPDGNLLGLIRDATERKRSEARIDRLNRLYAVLSAINALIVRAPDRESLFAGACRIAVETGGVALAWIGDYRDGDIAVPLTAWVGGTVAYRTELEALLAGGGLPHDTMEATLAATRAVVINDIANDAALHCREPALAAGLRACAVLPLCVAGKAVAVLTLGSDQRNAFDAEEMALLQDLADDLSFALDHQHKSEALRYLAYYDALTGLANRTLLLERLAQSLRGALGNRQRTALVIIDIERFKNLNATLGRATADELLRQVAGWLTGAAGDAGLVARVGPDQFALVLPEFVQDAEAGRFVGRIAEGFLRNPFHLGDTDYRIAAKFGVALSPGDGADADTLFRHAEAALKKAKASGERYLFYTPELTATMTGRLALESRLRHALDNGEFVLHYQPKVDLRSGSVVAVEALIRWNDPDTGLVAPGRFIPVLEETGLIDEVGRWALSQAIADHQRWRGRTAVAPRVAVNVSPLQLRNRGFVAEVEQAIAAHAGAGAGLELEITESMIMEDVDYSIASLKALRALGISIAIDDFGTGFSSLGSLARLPVDTLKIDRAFITAMDGSPNGLALVTTMINLAHSLGLKVVAEGVETEDQARLLRLVKCDQIQGFLFSRPLPREAFEETYLAPA